MVVIKEKSAEDYLYEIQQILGRRISEKIHNPETITKERYKALGKIYECYLEFGSLKEVIEELQVATYQEKIESMFKENPLSMEARKELTRYKFKFRADIWSSWIGNKYIDKLIELEELEELSIPLEKGNEKLWQSPKGVRWKYYEQLMLSSEE